MRETVWFLSTVYERKLRGGSFSTRGPKSIDPGVSVVVPTAVPVASSTRITAESI